MTTVKSLTLLTTEYNQMILITDQIKEIIAESGMKNGLVTIATKHTTTGIAVNESLECLESDIDLWLKRLVPEDYPYSHARMLRDYGSTAGNPTGHLKAHLTGNHCHLTVVDGEAVCGGAQDIYFMEFDGPAKRTITVTMLE